MKSIYIEYGENMKYVDTEVVAEVRKNREELLEEHGGIEGYLKYLQSQHSRWEAEGFRSVSFEEVQAQKYTEEMVNI
jgi:hypothetical protein